MEHPDLNGPLILLIYHQPSDFSRKSLKQTYLLMDRVDRMDQMDYKLYSKRSVVHLVYLVHQVHYKAFFLIALAEFALTV